MIEFAKLNDSPYWKSFGDAFAEIAGTFLSRECCSAAVQSRLPVAEVAAGIRLASTASQAELRIAVASNAESARAIGADLGDEDLELAGSLLQELVNLWMGATKSIFRRAEIVFTGGLPIALANADFDNYFADCVRVETVLLSCDDARFEVRAGLLPKKNSVIAVSSLREGMVLADDLHTDGGMLLITAGTRLSRRSVGRLTSMLPGSRTVTVAGVFA